jgi:hypothetical protein
MVTSLRRARWSRKSAHTTNPLLKGFGYVGGVLKIQGKYYLYNEHPINSTAPDYGPISLAIAEQPEGHWTPYAQNPVLEQGRLGSWDVGGFSEAQVLHFGGMFHVFYGGCTPHADRMQSRENIGYAYSGDGLHFTKYTGNPVASRDANPNAAAFAEVHALVEPPFVYLYHTLRYLKPWRPRDKDQFPAVEDLGVQILATQRPFQLDMPLFQRPSRAAQTTTAESDCPPLCLKNVRQLTLVIDCVCGPKAARGICVRVRTSPDGLSYAGSDVRQVVPDFQPGRPSHTILKFDSLPLYLKIFVENLDSVQSTGEVSITAHLAG